MNIQPITDIEFERFRKLIFDIAGISLSPVKKVMVSGRLSRRLSHHGLRSFGDYYHLVTDESHPKERQIMVDLLTTNETYFFREPAHFEFVRDQILPAIKGDSLRIWSAACSSGEEVYTLAMLMAEQTRIKDWHILGSDISQRMLVRAQRGLYPMERTSGISPRMMKKYCLKGVRSHAGTLLIDQRLKRHVGFKLINLMSPLSAIGRFDVIFLRNVLIYFDEDTKAQVVRRVISKLEPGGYFFTSHTETLHGISVDLEMVSPSIYRKP